MKVKLFVYSSTMNPWALASLELYGSSCCFHAKHHGLNPHSMQTYFYIPSTSCSSSTKCCSASCQPHLKNNKVVPAPDFSVIGWSCSFSQPVKWRTAKYISRLLLNDMQPSLLDWKWCQNLLPEQPAVTLTALSCDKSWTWSTSRD